MELTRRALGRGQPADFQAELQDAMERGKRRTSSEAGLEDHAELSRRVSTAALQLPDAGGFRGLNQQYPDDFLVNLLTLQFQPSGSALCLDRQGGRATQRGEPKGDRSICPTGGPRLP